jgi:2-hydroxychromene-2-carboxylate isomerase
VNRTIEFYFDYLSPYAYLAWSAIGRICEPRKVELRLRPVLLAGLLDHFGQLGPAEIPPKRQFVLRDAARTAARRGLPFRLPARHPFNPLPALRVSLPEVSGDRQADAVGAIFHAVWADGADVGDPDALARVLDAAGLDGKGLIAHTALPEIKAALRDSTERAIAHGAFGVPTFIVDGQLFWGDDQMQSIADVLDGNDPIDAAALDRAALQAPPMPPRRARK